MRRDRRHVFRQRGLRRPLGLGRRVGSAIGVVGRYVWASPTTSLGLAFVPCSLAAGGRIRIVDGVVEVCGGVAAWTLRRLVPLPGGAAAVTLGHVVLATDALTLDRTRRHERVHVRQAERWGPLFVPAYLAACVLAWWRGGHFYRDNLFEREAYACDT